jgi:hypothetical protein
MQHGSFSRRNGWSKIMAAQDPKFPDDKTAAARRKNLTDEQIKELELAGGTEGGMQAGSAGGPGAKEQEEDSPEGGSDQSPPNR